jgi:polyisoprenoid-binding protein YceI
MKTIIVVILFTLTTMGVQAQKLFTKNGNITFNSKSSLETIQATSNQVTSVLVPATGDLQFSVLVKSFHFEKALMEEHFNESYIESDKYPKATFKGKISNISKVIFAKDGAYAVTVSGLLTMHGVSKTVNTTGSIVIKGGKATSISSFMINLADYKISIPKVVQNNISENVTINVRCVYDQSL